MAGNAHLIRISRSAAIRLPVHTPVPGKGMATKNKRPQAPYFCTLCALPLPSDLSVNFSTSFLKYLVVLRYLKRGLTAYRIRGDGTMLPIKDKKVACSGDNPREMPTGIAPLSSITGSAAVNNTVNSTDKKLRNSVSKKYIPPFREPGLHYCY